MYGEGPEFLDSEDEDDRNSVLTGASFSEPINNYVLVQLQRNVNPIENMSCLAKSMVSNYLRKLI